MKMAAVALLWLVLLVIPAAASENESAEAILDGTTPTETTVTLGLGLSKASHFGIAASLLAETVARESGGRIHLEIFSDRSLGSERELVVGTQLGTVDMAIVSTGPVGSFVPETLALDIPFLFRDYAQARATLDGPIGRDLLDGFPSHGLIALAWGENGFRHITTRDRPVRTPADVAGLKMRTMQNSVHEDAFAALGAKPVPMPISAVYAALKSGAVDGEENPIPVILDQKYAEVQRYLSLTGHVYSPALILMSPRLWQSLSETDQAMFRKAATAAAAAMREAVTRQEAAGLATLRAAGMIIIDGIDKAAFQQALAPAYAEFARTFGQKRIDSLRNAIP